MDPWIEIAKAFGTGLGIAVPLIGTLTFFHTKRGERFDHIDNAQKNFTEQVFQLHTDFDGLTRQLGGIVADVERRFVAKDEHTAALNRLESTMRDLGGAISKMNSHLFDLARHQGGQPL